MPAINFSSPHDLNESALAAWMAAHVDGFGLPFTITKFPGGQSNPTYRIDCPHARFVLRRQPFGPLLPSAHAVDREFRMISTLYPLGFPVPRPVALCAETQILGAMFYIMECVIGRNFLDGALPDQAASARRSAYFSMIDTLAELHRIDPLKIGLEDYAKAGNYFERQVGRWTKQYRAAETDLIEAMERLIEYLSVSIPQPSGFSIVHGDYRLDNLIYQADKMEVCAVIDWELSTLGDPLADFSYLLMNWVMPPDGRAAIGGLNLEALGIPTQEEAIERYASSLGLTKLPQLDWYFAFNQFRLAAIMQGIKKRAMDGNASNPRAAEVSARVPMLAAQAWEHARRAGA